MNAARPLGAWGAPLRAPSGTAYLVRAGALKGLEFWRRAWSRMRHDRRFFEIVEATIREGFDYHYLILSDPRGVLRTVQPVFLRSQNLLDGVEGSLGTLVSRLHRTAPKLTSLRTLMVGSPVGEGGLDAAEEDRPALARLLAEALLPAARRLGASLVVLKEFPSEFRAPMEVLKEHGYTRIPSMPYAELDLRFKDFEEHMTRSMSRDSRADLRKKFRQAAAAAPLSLEVTTDLSAHVDELYPLYLQVYERATLRFEKLTPDYFRRLGREIPERTRFFIWTQNGRPIAFNACTLHDGTLWADYIGMDYRVAFDLHLYFIVQRDLINWACRTGLRRYCSTSMNYDPKHHLRFRLLPLDLYTRHVNPWANRLIRRLAPRLTPARRDPILKRFSNAGEL